MKRRGFFGALAGLVTAAAVAPAVAKPARKTTQEIETGERFEHEFELESFELDDPLPVNGNGNRLVSPEWMLTEYQRQLMANLALAHHINRSYDSAYSVEGGKIGVRLPKRYQR